MYFQDQLEDYLGEDQITDMIEVIELSFLSLQYAISQTTNWVVYNYTVFT